MSGHPTVAPPVWGLLARFGSARELLAAAKRVDEAGYVRWDAHSPFPVHGLEDLVESSGTKIGRLVGTGALVGAVGGMALQSWTSVVAYPLLVSGKPLFSWPAFVPITFELAILGGALGAVGGLLWCAGLPRLHHPLFASEAFEAATDDGFFLAIEAADALFEETSTRDLLTRSGALMVETIAAGSDDA